jgi:hypothetical protein
MKRRTFIAAALGGAAAWPVMARAQSERVRRIGVLMAVDDADLRASYAAFVEALQQLGWTDGRNVQIQTRSASQASDFRRHATDLVALAPDVIFSNGNAALPALLQATHTVPIVFAAVTDPVGAGFIETMAHPGGNATGFVQFEYTLSGKWLELLKEIAPSVTPSSGPSGSYASQWDRPIRDHTVRGAGARGGGDCDQLARCRRRYRTRRHGVCGLPKWRPHLDGERVVSDPSRTDHRACGQAQTACGLLPAWLRRQRRLDLLWL